MPTLVSLTLEKEENWHAPRITATFSDGNAIQVILLNQEPAGVATALHKLAKWLDVALALNELRDCYESSD